MSYQLLANGGVLRLSDSAHIPNDLDNVDWITYQEWSKTNKPTPAAVIPALPAKPTLEDVVAALAKANIPIEIASK